ncbi:MAG: hypothetical protein E6Q44_08340 [Flavobacteriales bacterium]|nr:MAG: hypothetical protein E6Q44_08340 [Flavobacteriales bacterium]
MNKQMWAALLAALSMNGVQAYDDAAVSTLLNDAVRARNQKAVAPPPGVARAAALGTDETPDVIASIDKLNEAFEQLLRGCDGRTGVLRSKLEKQTLRAERISIGGGLIGIIGTIVTCPHCAALASGLAGLANPMQQTFKENSDTPQDTRDALKQLSDTIRSDLEAYRRLPQPISTDKDYEEKLLNRIDALRIANASCHYYDVAAKTAGESVSTTPQTSGDTAKP